MQVSCGLKNIFHFLLGNYNLPFSEEVLTGRMAAIPSAVAEATIPSRWKQNINVIVNLNGVVRSSAKLVLILPRLTFVNELPPIPHPGSFNTTPQRCNSGHL